MLLRSLVFRSSLVTAFAVGASLLPSEAMAKKAAEGKPAFKAADAEGYWLWHDDKGWHLRTTAGKAQHSFRGVISAHGISDMSVTRPTLLTKVAVDGSAIRFEYDVFANGSEGMDWKTPDPCVSVELRLDNKPQPGRVHVGAAGTTVEMFPFDACQ